MFDWHHHNTFTGFFSSSFSSEPSLYVHRVGCFPFAAGQTNLAFVVFVKTVCKWVLKMLLAGDP